MLFPPVKRKLFHFDSRTKIFMTIVSFRNRFSQLLQQIRNLLTVMAFSLVHGAREAHHHFVSLHTHTHTHTHTHFGRLMACTCVEELLTQSICSYLFLICNRLVFYKHLDCFFFSRQKRQRIVAI